ncbi:MAG: type II secretion system ATPase GspE [Pseudomonadota bacterium]
MDDVTSKEEQQQPLRLPFGFARRHQLIYMPEEERLVCGKAATLQSIAEASRYLGRTLPVERADEQRFDALLQRVYEQEGNGSMQAMGEMGDEFDLNDVAQQIAEPEDLMESQDDAPIIRLINALLTEAVREGASDIHIESFEHAMVVRMRVDGILREVLRPKRALAPLLVSRIKVMARLDIAEKRLPQDGRISLKVAGRPVDVRVSTLPAGHGERVVLRLLDKQAGRLDLSHLGMEPEAQARMDDLIHHPHGILLVTGPTGSGKTTTLYAAITRLNDSKRNILTVEDPIEYYLDGIGQTQVNSKVDMSFARGLRAILRQDPDVVMVGEIRDLETVEIAIQASLTGHLVLSTLHTNTAIGAVTRLRDMGVEPFLLSSSLIGVLAQRLVRLLCPQCKQPYQANEHDLARLGITDGSVPTLYRASEEGCDHCNHLGYRGRTGVYELITIDQTLRSMIHDGQGEHEMERYARKHSNSILDDGIRRVLAGATSLEEVLRVCQAQ